ncbi:hypothetical protein HDV00_011032 [Rhizophlyctis rosea]|nr:hypothetical protein HDV00_011032 [Rhizophlyctis rosea]
MTWVSVSRKASLPARTVSAPSFLHPNPYEVLTAQSEEASTTLVVRKLVRPVIAFNGSSAPMVVSFGDFLFEYVPVDDEEDDTEAPAPSTTTKPAPRVAGAQAVARRLGKAHGRTLKASRGGECAVAAEDTTAPVDGGVVGGVRLGKDGMEGKVEELKAMPEEGTTGLFRSGNLPRGEMTAVGGPAATGYEWRDVPYLGDSSRGELAAEAMPSEGMTGLFRSGNLSRGLRAAVGGAPACAYDLSKDLASSGSRAADLGLAEGGTAKVSGLVAEASVEDAEDEAARKRAARAGGERGEALSEDTAATVEDARAAEEPIGVSRPGELEGAEEGRREKGKAMIAETSANVEDPGAEVEAIDAARPGELAEGRKGNGRLDGKAMIAETMTTVEDSEVEVEAIDAARPGEVGEGLESEGREGAAEAVTASTTVGSTVVFMPAPVAAPRLSNAMVQSIRAGVNLICFSVLWVLWRVMVLEEEERTIILPGEDLPRSEVYLPGWIPEHEWAYYTAVLNVLEGVRRCADAHTMTGARVVDLWRSHFAGLVWDVSELEMRVLPYASLEQQAAVGALKGRIALKFCRIEDEAGRIVAKWRELGGEGAMGYYVGLFGQLAELVGEWVGLLLVLERESDELMEEFVSIFRGVNGYVEEVWVGDDESLGEESVEVEGEAGEDPTVVDDEFLVGESVEEEGDEAEEAEIELDLSQPDEPPPSPKRKEKPRASRELAMCIDLATGEVTWEEVEEEEDEPARGPLLLLPPPPTSTPARPSSPVYLPPPVRRLCGPAPNLPPTPPAPSTPSPQSVPPPRLLLLPLIPQLSTPPFAAPHALVLSKRVVLILAAAQGTRATPTIVAPSTATAAAAAEPAKAVPVLATEGAAEKVGWERELRRADLVVHGFGGGKTYLVDLSGAEGDEEKKERGRPQPPTSASAAPAVTSKRPSCPKRRSLGGRIWASAKAGWRSSAGVTPTLV